MLHTYLKLIEGEPFYVGEGSETRALSNSDRNKLFRDRRQGKHICTLILSSHGDKTAAVLQEQGLISWLGRFITGEGSLTNILSGGTLGNTTMETPWNADEERAKQAAQKMAQTRIRKFREGSLKAGSWWNNGTNETTSIERPGIEWEAGRLPTSAEAKQKQRASKLGRTWWNNGKTTKLSQTQPGPEWRRGRSLKAPGSASSET